MIMKHTVIPLNTSRAVKRSVVDMIEQVGWVDEFKQFDQICFERPVKNFYGMQTLVIELNFLLAEIRSRISSILTNLSTA
jgi:hypothetical protein